MKKIKLSAKQGNKIIDNLLETPVIEPNIEADLMEKVTVREAFIAGQVNVMLRFKKVYMDATGQKEKPKTPKPTKDSSPDKKK